MEEQFENFLEQHEIPLTYPQVQAYMVGCILAQKVDLPFAADQLLLLDDPMEIDLKPEVIEELENYLADTWEQLTQQLESRLTPPLTVYDEEDLNEDFLWILQLRHLEISDFLSGLATAGLDDIPEIESAIDDLTELILDFDDSKRTEGLKMIKLIDDLYTQTVEKLSKKLR